MFGIRILCDSWAIALKEFTGELHFLLRLNYSFFSDHLNILYCEIIFCLVSENFSIIWFLINLSRIVSFEVSKV